jgi:ABC-type multidrug transport system fused ATPase/permease subunit
MKNIRGGQASFTDNISRLFKHLTTRRRWQLLGLFGLMLIGACVEIASLGAVVPFLAILASAVGNSCELPFNLCQLDLVVASLLFGAVVIISATVRVLLLSATTKYTYAIGAELANEVYRRTLFKPYSFHISHNTSEILSSIGKVNLLVVRVINPLMQGGVSVIVGFSILGVMIAVDPFPAVSAMLAVTCLYMITTRFSRKLLRENGKIISRTDAKRVQALQEGLGGIRDVLIDGTQRVFIDRFSRLNAEQRKAQGTNTIIATAPGYVIDALSMIVIVGLVLWISHRDGLASAIPTLGVLALSAKRLLPQMQQIFNSWASYNGNRAILLDVLDSLESETQEEYEASQPDYPKIQNKDGAAGKPLIALRGMGFRYNPEADNVLDEVDLEIKEGARVGFIGKTGSGKSTLLDLIMGLIDPTEGVIEIKEVPLTSSNRRQWQNRIAHVPQVIYLSDASIAENIAFGLSLDEIDMERVKRSARTAQIAEFIESLPEGYQTLVGERGVRLSGGQRQRIGLARAFYKNAEVLILDEATSALDDETEAKVMQAIHDLEREITVLMVAHRLTTLRACHSIVQLDKGRILRTGSYQKVVGYL